MERTNVSQHIDVEVCGRFRHFYTRRDPDVDAGKIVCNLTVLRRFQHVPCWVATIPVRARMGGGPLPDGPDGG